MKRVPASRYVLVILIAGAALCWDLYSKDVVFRDLGYPGGGVPVFQQGEHILYAHPEVLEGESVPYLNGWLTFRLFTSFNHGALWGVGQGYSWAFAFLSLMAIVGILYWLFVKGAATSRWLSVALAFVLGGTLGNLYDRFGLHGCIDTVTGEKLYAVRDFLLFTYGTRSWPVFNFADTYLVTGAIMLVLQSFTADGKGKSETSATNESEAASTVAAGRDDSPTT